MANEDPRPCRPLPLAGGAYRWCGCGGSRRRPFCDPAGCPGPERCRPFEIEGFAVVRLCRCQQTRTPPYCDGDADLC